MTAGAVRKHAPADPDALRVEAAGLRWLAAAAPDGGARVVAVVAEAPGRLDTARVRTTAPTPATARDLGRRLAVTHAAGAPAFGCAPPGWSGPGRIGAATLPLVPPQGPGPSSWGAFYAEHRVLPYVRPAVEHGALSRADAVVVERLAERLADGALDHPQPALVRGPVARIHGDLWSGNVLWDADDAGAAVLIDPAAHGGHAETDLAMLALFGQAHLDDVVAGYQEASAFAPGRGERVTLHQVHPLLVHAVLFGGGYGPAASRAAARYL